jgi:hypothetical protein
LFFGVALFPFVFQSGVAGVFVLPILHLRRATMRDGLKARMPLYYFRIRTGQFSGAADQDTELADDEAAWAELTKVCSDLVGSITRKLKQNAEWQMDFWTNPRSLCFESGLSQKL